MPKSRIPLIEAGDQVESLVTRAQAILAAYLPPDSGITPDDVINSLFELLDGREQQQIQAAWKVAKLG